MWYGSSDLQLEGFNVEVQEHPVQQTAATHCSMPHPGRPCTVHTQMQLQKVLCTAFASINTALPCAAPKLQPTIGRTQGLAGKPSG
jgi:hypothetical protein